MNLQELQTVVHHNLPIKLFVINNNGYLSIKITQESFFNGNEIASGPESGISFPDLQKLSYAYGIPYYKIESNCQIEQILKLVFETNGPVLCELVSYPYEKHEPKVVHKGIDSNGKIIPGDLTDMHISDVFNL
jgi:acetolactate synthase-1/2/3 large subunit